MNDGETRDAGPAIAPPILPDHPPTFRHLDPAAALAFRTPLQEHPPAADTNASATLTALGIMFPLLARFERTLSNLLAGHNAVAVATFALLIGFAVLSVGVVMQAFRTFSPRSSKTSPSLAFFRDIAGFGRDVTRRHVTPPTRHEVSPPASYFCPLLWVFPTSSVMIRARLNSGAGNRFSSRSPRSVTTHWRSDGSNRTRTSSAQWARPRLRGAP